MDHVDQLDGVSATLAARRLATILRDARREPLRLADVAKAAGCSQPTWSKVENGTVIPTADHLTGAMGLLEIDASTSEELLALRERAKRTEWWQEYQDVAPPEYLKLIGYEASAIQIRHCSSGWIPGLLQTPDWARAAIECAGTKIRPENVEQVAELRVRRQRVLDRASFRYHVICGQEALLYRPGGDDVQVAQLKHLLDLVAANDRVQLQVTPFTGPLHPGHSAPYAIMDFADRRDTPIVQLEHTSSEFIDMPSDVRRWAWVFDNLARVALPPHKTVQLIESIIRRHPHESPTEPEPL